MSFIIIQILTIFTLLAIAYQDYHDRKVYLLLFLLFMIEGACLFLIKTSTELVVIYSFINLFILAIMLGICAMYARYIMKKSFLKDAFGSGDLLFLCAMAISFDTMEFLTFLVFSIIFSFLLHWLDRKSKFKTVPLAGYASLFLSMVFLVQLTKSILYQ